MAEATQEMIALAREIVLNLYPDWFPGERAMILGGSWDRTPAVQAALAAIQATTERAAKLAENRDGYDDITGTVIAGYLRANAHLKEQSA